MTDRDIIHHFGSGWTWISLSGLDIDLWVWPELAELEAKGSAVDTDLAFSRREVLQLRLECENEPSERPSCQHISSSANQDGLFLPLATKGTSAWWTR